MKLISNFLFTAAMMLMAGSLVFGQVTDNFSVTYDIEFDGDQLDPMSASMMEGSTMKLTFSGKRSRVDMDMQMMSTTAITDENLKQGLVYITMDMMGMRQYKPITEAEFEENIKNDDFDIERTGETMEIAGYEAEKVIMTAASGETMEMWVTSEIRPSSTANQYTYEGLNGLPLKMQMTQDNLNMTFTAAEVNTETPDEAMFDLTPPEGYELMEE